MSTSIDQQIVEMKIDNKQFEPGANRALAVLDRLKNGLNFSSSKKSMDELQQSANGFNLNPLSGATQSVSAGFVAMSTAAITALANIVNRAVDTGINVAKALTIDPIKLGLEEYETNLNSIQTILANTQASGATLTDVENSLGTLNEYADQTIYNFGEMARNIGTFTAAGVDLDTSTAAIKGIANLAALSGSNSQQASTAMYQLSQAISAGKVGLQDWNSVVNAGMGGTAFQRALSTTAVKMGALDESAVKLNGSMKNVTVDGKSFRESLTPPPGGTSWLTSDILTTTLAQFTGDLTDAELAAQGFTEAEIKSIQQTAKTAQGAATEVKTITQLMDTLKEGVGSGWATTWQTIVGDFEEAKKLWTGVSETVGGFLGSMADGRNEMLKTWKSMGGRDVLIAALTNAFSDLMDILKPIKEAFRSVFPAATGEQLLDLTVAFHEFFANIQMGEETSENLKRTFRGLFSLISIGKQVITGLFGVFFDLLGPMGEAGGGILSFTGNLGDWLYSLDQALKKGDGLSKFFDGLGDVLGVPLKVLKYLTSTLGGFTEGWSDSSASAEEGSLAFVTAMAPLEALGLRLKTVWESVTSKFSELWQVIEPMVTGVSEAVGSIFSAISEGFSTGNFDGLIDLFNVGLLGAIALGVKRLLDGGLKHVFEFGGGGPLGQIGDSFEALTGTLEAMQAQIKSKALINIAIAVALLTASVMVLSTIDSKALAKALTAMAVGFGQLMASLALLVKMGGTKGMAFVPALASGLVLLAAAILILSLAVSILSRLSWEELSKGLVGTTVLLMGMVAAGKLLQGVKGAFIRVGLGMIPFAMGLLILAAAMKVFATMSWEEMAKGMAGLAGAMTIVALALKFMPKNLLAIGAGLVGVGIGISAMAISLKILASMSWNELGFGLMGLGIALTMITIALRLMPSGKKMLSIGLGLMMVSGAVAVLATSLVLLGTMSYDAIGRGLTAMGGGLLILASAVVAMNMAKGGAGALLLAAAAIAVLVPSLVILSALSIVAIATGLLAMALAIGVIAAAALLLQPALIPLAIFAASLLAIAVAMGVIAMATSIFVTVLNSIKGSITAFTDIVLALVNMIPELFKAVAKGLVDMIVVLGEESPRIVEAVVSFLSSIIAAIIEVTPKIGEMIYKLVETMLNVLVAAVPSIVTAGVTIIIKLLEGIAKKVPALVRAAVDVATAFMRAIGKEAPRLADAGFKMLIDFINGLTKAVEENSEDLATAGYDLAEAIIEGLVGGLGQGVDRVIEGVKNLGRKAISAGLSVFGINSPSKVFQEQGYWNAMGLVKGMDDNANRVTKSVSRVGRNAVETMRDEMSTFWDIIDTNFDLSPTISPVLDLSEITKGASTIGNLLSPGSISPDVSIDQASILREEDEGRPTTNEFEQPVSKVYNFEQHIHSPKAISDGEIYRNTRNQFSMAQEVVG